MKKLAILGVTVAAMLGSPAMAAAPTPYTWTGCYVGGNFGLGKQDTDTTATLRVPSPPFSSTGGTANLGWSNGISGVGGGQVGCDYQMTSNWVVGIRGMMDYAPINQSLPYNVPIPNSDFSLVGTDGVRTDWFATLLGRLGYLAGPDMLMYVKGGAAWKRVSYSDNGCVESSGGTSCHVFDTYGVASWSGSGSATILGWDVGAGFEYALFPNISTFVEADYMGFPSNTTTLNYTACLSAVGCVASPQSHSYEHDIFTLLVGMNWRWHP